MSATQRTERQPFRQRGFTLIEVLVAVAVLAIAMGAIIGAVSRYADNAGYLREKSVAGWVAHNRLARFTLAPHWPATGEQNGHTRMAGRTWYWHAKTQATQDPALRRIDVTVSANKGGATVASLTGFMTRPAQSAQPQP